jgi:hypothetical protein
MNCRNEYGKEDCGKTFDHVRSQDIMHRCGIQDISEWVNKGNEWNKQFSRMTPVKIVPENSHG